MARLLFYITTCVSVLRFERRNSASIGFFEGVLLPVIGAVSSVTMIILAVDSLSLAAAGAAVLAGALIYGIQFGFSADPGED